MGGGCTPHSPPHPAPQPLVRPFSCLSLTWRAGTLHCASTWRVLAPCIALQTGELRQVCGQCHSRFQRWLIPVSLQDLWPGCRDVPRQMRAPLVSNAEAPWAAPPIIIVVDTAEAAFLYSVGSGGAGRPRGNRR